MGPRLLAVACCALVVSVVTHAEAGTRWRGGVVEIQVEPSLRGLEPQAVRAVERAADRWSAVPGAPELQVTTSGDERALGYDPRGATNSLVFAPEGSPLVGGALAITLLTYDADTLELLDADVIFNGKHRLVDVTSCEPDGVAAYDFEGVLQHELGHVLGLEEDFEHPEAVMYPYAPPWSTSSRSLKEPDESALQGLYSTPIPGAPAGCVARVSPFGARLAVWNWALTLGLVSVALGRRGRRGWLKVVLSGSAVALLMSGPGLAWGEERVIRTNAVEVARSDVLAQLEVVGSLTRWDGGVLYTDLQLATRVCEQKCGELPNRLTLVGGSRDGVVQVLGREPVPGVGAFLEVVAPPPRDGNRFKARQYRTVFKTKGGESLWIQ
ncbi:MAG: matrixin family metalloprotease [Polyangiaceae bacterium]